MKRLRLKKILVPIDFSALAEGALRTARRLADEFEAAVHLVYVHPYRYLFEYMEPGEPVPRAVEDVHEEGAREAAKKLETLGRKHGIPAKHCYVQEGVPVFDEICRVAQALRVDLIVLPTHGRTGLKHVFLGSTAERVVQHAPCPVWIDRGKFERLEKILIPVDFSPCAMEAMRCGATLSERTGASLTLLHVVQFGLVDGHVMDNPPLPAALRKEATEQMQGFIRAGRLGATRFKTEIHSGAPAATICRFAQRGRFDLILTGTHGWSGLQRLLIGSTAEHVVRRATVPVLVLPSHAKARAESLRKKPQRKRARRAPSAMAR